MRISGFSFVRNADRLFYPVRESILSVLPLVDEFVIAIGDCAPGDGTVALIESIGSPKIKIIHTVWDTATYPKATIYAQQTNVAKEACTGDWLLYIQGDEVLHERDYAAIRSACEKYVHNDRVEGLLFAYRHFWADYNHINRSHSAYGHEIRMIKNLPDIYSYGDAQGFRRIPGFDKQNFRQKEGVFKLHVAKVDAHVYHYGWVRPPDFMMRKKQFSNTLHHGQEKTEANFSAQLFDYGPVGRKPAYKDTHPAVMQERIAAFDWGHMLNYSKHQKKYNRPPLKHEKWHIRLLSFFEIYIFKRQLFTAHKYILVK